MRPRQVLMGLLALLAASSACGGDGDAGGGKTASGGAHGGGTGGEDAPSAGTSGSGGSGGALVGGTGGAGVGGASAGGAAGAAIGGAAGTSAGGPSTGGADAGGAAGAGTGGTNTGGSGGSTGGTAGGDAAADAGIDVSLGGAGGADAGDAAAPPVAFRFSDLDLRDPHMWVSFLGCRDVTDVPLGGFSVNGAMQDEIQTDGDSSGHLDFSPLLLFRSYDQSAATQPIEVHFATCTAPMAGSSCSPGTVKVLATATNMSAGNCLSPVAGTVHGYSPAITSTNAPCFVTSAITLTVALAGIPITLHDAKIAATYVGNPANDLVNGLLRGFVSEADANATMVPTSSPIIGGQPLSTLLAGGDPPGNGGKNCAAFSDKDTNNGVSGWWFYLNFSGTRVPWSDN